MVKLKLSLRKFYGRQPLQNICVTNDYIYVPFVIITIRFLPHRVFNTVSEGMSDCCLTPIQQFFSCIVYHGENKLIFNEMMMRSALFLTNMLSWIFIVLAHWNNSPRIDMSLHIDTLFWFRAIQSLLLLLIATCLAEKQHIPILLSLVRPGRGSNPRSTALEMYTLTVTPPMRCL